MDVEPSSLQDHQLKRFNSLIGKLSEYNEKARKARIQYKLPMFTYYATKIFAILDIVGRKKAYLDLVPTIQDWYDFCKEAN